ncbi:hypothetical protein HYR69_11400 [Candidatus Sumerlaeota bacterium]|nr:hypothetical protein [Candidatus Sumerlaeota bacterium]
MWSTRVAFHLLHALWIFSYFASSYAQNEDQPSAIPPEAIEQLRPKIEEFRRQRARVIELTLQAEERDSVFKKARKANNMARDYYNGPLGELAQRWREYKAKSSDPKTAEKYFKQAQARMGKEKVLMILENPAQVEILKDVVIIQMMRALKENRLGKLPADLNLTEISSLDPAIPDQREKIWEWILGFHKEMARLSLATRDRLKNESGLPDWVLDYAGENALYNFLLEGYWSAIALHTPPELDEARKKYLKLASDNAQIHPNWGSLLPDEERGDPE